MQWPLLLKCHYSFISANGAVELCAGFSHVISVGQGLKGSKSFLGSCSVPAVPSLSRCCLCSPQEGNSCVHDTAASLTSKLFLSRELVQILAPHFRIWFWMKPATCSFHVEKLSLRSEQKLLLMGEKKKSESESSLRVRTVLLECVSQQKEIKANIS